MATNALYRRNTMPSHHNKIAAMRLVALSLSLEIADLSPTDVETMADTIVVLADL